MKLRRLSLQLVLIQALLLGCAPTAPPPTVPPTATASPSDSAAVTASPSPTFDATGFLPLPRDVPKVPAQGEFTVSVEADTERTLVPDPTIGYPFQIGHCGLGSRIDVDGSLWLPVAAHNGQFGPLNDDQTTDLNNESQATFYLIEPDTALLVTASSAFVLLRRSDGPVTYHPCA